MKRLIALAAILGIFAAAPVFAQQVETLPSGKKVKIVEKEDGTVIILPADEETQPNDKAEKKTEEKTEKTTESDSKADDGINKELEDDFDGDLPQEVKDMLKRVRSIPNGTDKNIPEDMRKAMKEMHERLEKFRKEAEERFEKMRKEMKEGQNGKTDDDGDNEVEEYDKEAPDGSWKIHIKIVRRTSKSNDSTPEVPKKQESERKQ